MTYHLKFNYLIKMIYKKDGRKLIHKVAFQLNCSLTLWDKQNSASEIKNWRVLRLRRGRRIKKIIAIFAD